MLKQITILLARSYRATATEMKDPSNCLAVKGLGSKLVNNLTMTVVKETMSSAFPKGFA